MTRVLRGRCFLPAFVLLFSCFALASFWGCGPVDDGSSGDTQSPPPTIGPADDGPTKQQPTQEQPTETPPTEEQPTETLPTEEQPTEVPPTEEQPTEAPPTEAPPTEEQPTEVPPTEEQPTEAPPTEAPPTEEQPTEEQPTEAAPAEEQPTEDAATSDGSGEALKPKIDPTDNPTPAWLPEPVEVADAAAATEGEMKSYTEKIPNTDLTFELVRIPGGKFMMGSPESEEGRWQLDENSEPVKDDQGNKVSDEGPQHEITIEPFWMGKYEVTWEEYEMFGLKIDQERWKNRLAEIKGKATARDLLIEAVAKPTAPYIEMSSGMGKDDRPAICMSHLAAQQYCKWLSAKTGRYYRLPTEAEWEYACRAGTTTAYSFGDDPEKLDEYAWHYDNSDEKYHEIGQKKPNPWGLYDMHGNVMEWVNDGYEADFYQQFAGKTTKNPSHAVFTEYPHVARGGCWDDYPEQLRSTARRKSTNDWRQQDPQIPQSIWYTTETWCPGFRVVRPLRVPTAEEAKRFEPDAKLIREYQEAQAGKE